MKTTLLLISVLMAFSVEGQTKKTSSKAAPTVQQLQQQVIDLQTRLMECQGEVKAAHAVATPNPMKEALEAFQTFNSTVGTGLNQAAYKAALIPLKVKVDKLPDNEQTTPMKKTLELFVDAGTLWNISITRAHTYGLDIPVKYVQPFIAKYNNEWMKLDTAKRELNPDIGGCNSRHEQVWASCVKALEAVLIDKGQENIKGFTTASQK